MCCTINAYYTFYIIRTQTHAYTSHTIYYIPCISMYTLIYDIYIGLHQAAASLRYTNKQDLSITIWLSVVYGCESDTIIICGDLKKKGYHLPLPTSPHHSLQSRIENVCICVRNKTYKKKFKKIKIYII